MHMHRTHTHSKIKINSVIVTKGHLLHLIIISVNSTAEKMVFLPVPAVLEIKTLEEMVENSNHAAGYQTLHPVHRTDF